MRTKAEKPPFWTCVFLVAITVPSLLAGTGCANLALGGLAAMQANSRKAAIERNKKPELTQLQIRQMQTRQIPAGDVKKVLTVALAVLQDDGFSVQNANTELGLLSASKQLHEEDVDEASTAFAKGFMGSMGGVSRHTFTSIEATVTVAAFGEETRVRMSARLAQSGGGNIRYEAVTEPEYYQAFFTKLEKGLFIEREKI